MKTVWHALLNTIGRLALHSYIFFLTFLFHKTTFTHTINFFNNPFINEKWHSLVIVFYCVHACFRPLRRSMITLYVSSSFIFCFTAWKHVVYCYDANGLETMATPTGLKEMFFRKIMQRMIKPTHSHINRYLIYHHNYHTRCLINLHNCYVRNPFRNNKKDVC